MLCSCGRNLVDDGECLKRKVEKLKDKLDFEKISYGDLG